ncbi:MAG: IS21 family transposase [Candidatus Aminicenantes bacterium]|nr:IS21 family transposase [Candidatus Aminicenantes bacterium]
MNQKERKILPIIDSGGESMVNGDFWHEIHSRFKLQESKKSIARTLGISVQTVRKILRQEKPVPYQRREKTPTIIVPYEDYIRQRLAAVGYCAQSIFEELQERGYTGSYDQVKRYVRPLREEAKAEATSRFETPPGKQGQVDWGQCWTVIGGKRSKAHLFVMTLGYSRKFFSKGTNNEKLSTFINCHREAFDHFGGLPHEVVYDNAKSVVVSRDFEGRHIQWNPTFWDFSQYYGFRPWAHRPYRAQTKGKVESGIKYVKRFLRGKTFDSLEHLNDTLMRWVTAVADQRIHGTTHRKPVEMFEEERDILIDHRLKPPYVIQDRVIRHVSKDCMVTFETNRYSVHFRFVGKQVEVQSEPEQVRIYHQGQLIAVHPRCRGNYQLQLERAHYEGIFSRRKLPEKIIPSQTSPDEVEVRDLGFYERLVEGGAV